MSEDVVENTNSREPRVIALDIGGSSIKSAVVAPAGRLMKPPVTMSIDSRADGATIVATFAAAIRQHLPEASAAQFLGVAIGCPGPFDYTTGVSYITGVDKYEALYGLNVGMSVRAQLELDEPMLPIVFRNDAEVAILGEARYGAGRSYRRLIGVTLGTGLGSCFVVNGASVTDEGGVPPNGWLYDVSYRGVQADDVFSTRGLLAELRAIDATHDSVAAFAAAARGGNTPVRQAFAQFGDNLGKFLHPFAITFGAEAVLMLGGIAEAIDLFEASSAHCLTIPVLAGQLGTAAALIGAADLLFNP